MADFFETEPETSTLALSAEVRGNFAAIPFSVGQRNWAPPIIIWPAGDASAPAFYRVTGAGVAVARETTTVYQGDMSVKVTSGGGAVGVFERRIIQAADWGNWSFLDGLDFAAMVPVWTASATAVRIGLYDGVDTVYSDYHTGGSGWELLQVKRIIGSGGTPTELTLRGEGNASVVAYYGQPCFRPGPIKPGFWQPPEVEFRTLAWSWAGEIATGDDALGAFPGFGMPALVMGCDLYAQTAPTGQALQVQLAKNGSADIFITKPEIAATANAGSQAADGTYANRCLARNDRVHLDIDQVGNGGEEGENVQVWARCLVPNIPTQPYVTFGTVE